MWNLSPDGHNFMAKLVMPVRSLLLPVSPWYLESALGNTNKWHFQEGEFQMVTIQERDVLSLVGHDLMAKWVAPVHHLPLPASPWYFTAALCNNIKRHYQSGELWSAQMTENFWRNFSVYTLFPPLFPFFFSSLSSSSSGPNSTVVVGELVCSCQTDGLTDLPLLEEILFSAPPS